MAYQATAKTEATRADNRNKILLAAHKLVLEGGFNSITISAVAKTAGLATGSMYRHFANKIDLCTELFCQLSAIEVEQLAAIAALDDSPAELLGQCCRTFVSRAFRGPRQSYALIAEPLGPELEAQRLIYRKGYAEVLTKIIQAGIDRGEFPSQNAELAATAIVGMLSEPLIAPLRQDGQAGKLSLKNKDEIQQSMATLCLRALGFMAWELLPTQFGNKT